MSSGEETEIDQGQVENESRSSDTQGRYQIGRVLQNTFQSRFQCLLRFEQGPTAMLRAGQWFPSAYEVLMST